MRLVIIIIAYILGISIVYAKESIAIIRQDGKAFEDVVRGLTEELNDQFVLDEIIIDKRTPDIVVHDHLESIHPKLVVLMDNIAIALYRRYQATLDEHTQPIPSISLMGVMIKDAIAGLKNAVGISYEIPIVTSVVSLRMVLRKPVKSVGVVYREFLRDFMEENREYCAKEHIELIDIALPNKSASYRTLLRNALVSLEKEAVESIWIPNDNVILQPDLIRNVWIPMVKKNRIAVMVGVEALVMPRLNLGTFAVLPDHVALGSQAGEMVYEIMENNWTASDHAVDPPLAVYKIINLRQARNWFRISDEQLKAVDKKLE